MAKAKRTRKQVEAFLNSLVGQSVNAKCGIYMGQCVSLIKALLEYLGAPDPYKARGNAKDVGNTLIRENIGERGKGKILTVVVNKHMGRINGQTYGHIWALLNGRANFEQNGAKALRVTKNTRPTSQGEQFVNLDKWIKPEPKPAAKKYLIVRAGEGLSLLAKRAGYKDYGSSKRWAAIAKLNGSSNWESFNNKLQPGQKVRVK